MHKIILPIVFALASFGASAQQVYDRISVDFSPAMRKLAVFSTLEPSVVIDLKMENMEKRDADIISFFLKLQELEAQGWETEVTQIYSTGKESIPMYVWIMRKPKTGP